MKVTKRTLVKDAPCTEHIYVQINKKLNFNLKDAGVRGGEMLVSDPCKWSELESEYLAVGLNFSSSRHSREGGNPESLR